MNIRIKRTTKVLETLQNKIKALSSASVASGYFEDSGTHEESGMSFAELMNLHEYGNVSEDTYLYARPVRSQTFAIATKYNIWGDTVKNYLKGNYSVKTALNNIGVEVTTIAQDMFGDPTVLTSNAKSTRDRKGGRNTPLVDTGSLRDAWTWKVSLTNN